MKTSKMPPGLARYWRKHGSKLGGVKRARKTKRDAARGIAKARRYDKRTHRVHHVARCSHAHAQQVVTGIRGVLWCRDCGALCDGHRWHRPHG